MKIKELIKQHMEEKIKEGTGTGAVAGFQTPYAFKDGQKGDPHKDMGNIRAATQLGYSKVEEIEKANEELGIIKEIVDRSMENRRADALIEIAELAISMKGNLVKHHRRPASINIVMDLATALGLANNPGFLTGYGPIPADVARHFANDGKWKKFITDPGTGNLLDMGRETYVPPQQLQDFLIARDRTCRFPGCRKSALRSEIDHAIPWEKGGKTNPENMGVLCKRHHRLKTHGDWKLKSFPDGSCEWTSPNGRVIPVPARPMLDAV